ncbi:MAG: chemotaxis protein CheR [Candidatus Delongbacteria bacterium]|nr:chemotaxis protein CheR [Candidatus Delongbacteria bacterium]
MVTKGKDSSSAPFVDISPQEFHAIADLVYQTFGIHLTDQKITLVKGRLQTLLKEMNMISFKQYYDYVVQDRTDRALIELINLLTTNHTYFNREREHFDFITRSFLPRIESETLHDRDIRIWSAGCSSGEEPYMLVILMMEFFGESYHKWKCGVLATDISDRVIRLARSGIYPEERLKELPNPIRLKYFHPMSNRQWQVNDPVRNEVTYRRFNLMNSVFPFKKGFHAIFCRNVMIYFDLPTRTRLIERFYHHLVPGGYLFIGHSETLGRDHHYFKYIQPALYQRL